MQLWSQTKIKHTLNLNQISVSVLLLLAPVSALSLASMSKVMVLPASTTFPMPKQINQ